MKICTCFKFPIKIKKTSPLKHAIKPGKIQNLLSKKLPKKIKKI